MDPNCNTAPHAHPKIPKEGMGPRGFPDCYYMSRVLDSTGRYVRFVKKLRALEEEERIGREDLAKKSKDNRFLSFFQSCDRKALVNKVAQRVNLALESYQEDLKEKRNRLAKLLTLEEEQNVRLFIANGQAGAEQVWNDKMDRLNYLLAKRKKEADEKYSDIPLAKCVHLHPCLIAARKRECQDVLLYQIREKQMRKEAEREIDKMWHDLAMRESDALAARLEYDVIERLRRDKESKEYTQYQVEMARQKKAKAQKMLKQEALLMKADVEAYYREQEEEKRKREEHARENGKAKREMVKERDEILAKQKQEAKLMEDTWSSIAQAGAEEDIAKDERRKQKEKELDECNFKMNEMKKRIELIKDNNEAIILQEGQRIRDAADLKRCQYKKWSENLKKEHSEFNKRTYENQVKERVEQRTDKESLENERQLREQLDALVKYKELTEGQARKLHQNDLLQQMEYTKLLKERAQQEEIKERKKCQIAQREYQEEIGRMLCRPFYSDDVHPFLRQMSSGLKMAAKCPCSLPDHCADPVQPIPTTVTQKP